MATKIFPLEATRIIHDQLKGSKLSKDICRKMKNEITAGRQFFKTSSMNAMILSSIVQESFIEGEVELRELVNYYEIDSRMIPAVYGAVEELTHAGLITKVESGFRNRRKLIPFHFVLEALIKNDRKKILPKAICSISDVFTKYNRIQQIRNRANIDHAQSINQIIKLVIEFLPLANLVTGGGQTGTVTVRVMVFLFVASGINLPVGKQV